MKKAQIINLITESRSRSSVYESKIMEVERSFRELDSTNMQALLMQVEDFLDNNNVYAYANWLDGMLWDGPDVSRHWIEFIIKYKFDEMPDPRAAKRLTNAGAVIRFEEAREIVPIEHMVSPAQQDPITKKPKEVTKPIWLVHFKIPKKLIQDVSAESHIPDDVANEVADEPVGETMTDDNVDNDSESSGGELPNELT